MPKKVGKRSEALNQLEVTSRAKKVRGIILSGHAKERMKERDISLQDIQKVLKNGYFCSCRYENGSWKYFMELDRHDLCCVHGVAFKFNGKDRTVIITVINKVYKK